MGERNILVVVVDGLRASALGAYGNTTYPTPALDKFASQSFLFDNCFAPSADLAANYRALWQGIHPLRPAVASPKSLSIPQLAADAGYHAVLVTDEPQLVANSLASAFQTCIEVEDQPPRRVSDISQTRLARLFAAACDQLDQAHSSPRLVWSHSRAICGPWDAPIELQESLLDEDDSPPIESIAMPDFRIGERDDPDSAFRYSVAYAAQTMVLDACWELVENTLAKLSSNNDWLVMLVGARGFPLGEHRQVGGVDARLYIEQLHVPWLLRLPGGNGRLGRSSRLVSFVDALPTLQSWIRGAETTSASKADGMSVLPLLSASKHPWRDALIFGNADGRRAIRNSSWSLICNSNDDLRELYVRPDDRWEANDVASRCPEVVEELAACAEVMTAELTQGPSAAGS